MSVESRPANEPAPKAPENFDAFYGRLCEMAGASEPEAVLQSLRKALDNSRLWLRAESNRTTEILVLKQQVAKLQQEQDGCVRRGEDAENEAGELRDRLRAIEEAIIAAGAHDLDNTPESTAVTQIEALSAERRRLEAGAAEDERRIDSARRKLASAYEPGGFVPSLDKLVERAVCVAKRLDALEKRLRPAMNFTLPSRVVDEEDTEYDRRRFAAIVDELRRIGGEEPCPF